MRKNKGYTLVEMIVVIAIMAVLSGLAAVSIGLIYKAKARDAMQVFNSQLSNTWLRTKSTASGSDTMYAVMTYTDKGLVFDIYDKNTKDSAGKTPGLIDGPDIRDGNTEYSPSVKKWTSASEWNDSIKISYVPYVSGNISSDENLSDDKKAAANTAYNTALASQTENGYGDAAKQWYIQFNKSTGEVLKGAGEYIFIAGDGTVVGRVYLDKITGNHFSVDNDGSTADAFNTPYYINKGTVQSTTTENK